MEIPKYIIKKINRLDKLLSEAQNIKWDIEQWAEKQGADTLSPIWNENILDINTCSGISLAALEEYLESCK